MNQTIMAVFDEYGDAQSALNALYQEGGFTSAEVKLSPAAETAEARQQAIRTQPGASTDAGGWSIGDFFRSLFGRDQHGDDAGVYSEAVRRGAYLISVDAQTDEQAAKAVDILQRFNAIDLDQRAAGWRSSGWSGYQADSPLYTAEEIRKDRDLYSKTSTATATGSQPSASGPQTRAGESSAGTKAIPVIEEQLQVGKRLVQRGGIRVFRHVTETPVEESVQLREEHVSVERRPVDEPATAADLEAFKEGTIEIRETAEEPVIAKTARVVEEVEIAKEVTQRTETVSDTVRRTDVEVEPLEAKATTSASLENEDEFRQHWQTAYGSTGGRYEDYSSAYRYGASLAGQKQYQGYRWDELEPRVKSDWEATHAGSPWDRTKQAIRYGWEKTTTR
jgi:uncharacterized protein (TIGR02271 family)